MKPSARIMPWLAATSLALVAGAWAAPVPAPPLPTNPDQWIGARVTWESLRGKVVVVDIWTFG